MPPISRGFRGRRPTVVPATHLDALADPAEESVAEEDFRRHLIGRVVRVLEKDFPPDVWRAFWTHVIDGKPASRVAAELGINIWAVYTAKVRVLAHLHKELSDLVTD